ncbi:DNA (cytosine-5)-methyltransferase 1 [Clostridium amylolyticum]|uniref:Cytosine-specific methyltransferase n=1 Tax=Clostridium amylolyticum TaxID=1121298 RepID=A0A1M6LRS9_9CLOT|nr:DNA cytosine methyltransferase [Clostridium amylolyticum]SHJ73836.1 DNA (cytosine-5)-methyltransferase 1 [Clostridium amylolyticum]
MKKYTTIDLFAGAGGLSYGFLETGKFDVKIAVEYNKNAQKTYIKNHRDVDIKSDITKITDSDYKNIRKKYGDIDIIIGGPPCQGFSNANRQRNELISGNNQLINQYIRAVENLEPKAFVMENVKMIKSDKHKFFCSKETEKVVEKLGVELKKETITIAEATICPDEFIEFLKREQFLDVYILEQKNYIKLNTIYRKCKTPEKLNEYFQKSELAIKKIIVDLESTNIRFWNPYYREIFNKTKDSIRTFLVSRTGYESIKNNLKIIIETQKAIYKMKEVRDHDIILLDMIVEKNNICLVVNTYNVIDYTIKKFVSMGYAVKGDVLNAVNFGVPQSRERFILIGVKSVYLKKNDVELPEPVLKTDREFYKIGDAIKDLAEYDTSTSVEALAVQKDIKEGIILNPLQRYLNNDNMIYNHITTDTRDTALGRFEKLKPGQNFHDLDDDLKTTYSDPTRTQNTIYLRLNYEMPSGTVLNVRKSMWIHPEKNRAISIREAARLQSFPDSFKFYGTKDSQYQQIGNAVPPLLGRAIAEKLLELLGDEPDEKLSDIIVREDHAD